MNKQRATRIASETLDIAQTGSYVFNSNFFVNIKEEVQSCIRRTQCFSPETLGSMVVSHQQVSALTYETTFSIENETTLEGARELEARFGHVGVLNFASAKNPGGGFLRGTLTQEETLARSSALFYSLLECPGYYDGHKEEKSALYSDRMILSPRCPVFRTDDGKLLQKPYLVDFVTSAAPNLNVAATNFGNDTSSEDIQRIWESRVSKMLALFMFAECNAIVLGAWGCGVFRNDPQQVADIFYKMLIDDDAPFSGVFEHVHFAVLDKGDGETYKAFAQVFPNTL